MPKVDVIVPAYNAARYLRAALDSVVDQSFPDWRILLVDDGSTDETGAIAAEYAARLGPRMKVLTQANAGLPAARNAAIRAGDADLLALLDADDVWMHDRLLHSVAALDQDVGAALSYGLITRIDGDGNVRGTFAGNGAKGAGWVAAAIYKRQIELPCPTVTFRRRCLAETGLFDESMRATEDRDLWLRLALTGRVIAIPKVLAWYRTSPSSMSVDTDRMLRSQVQFLTKHRGAPGCGRRAFRQALSRVWKQQAEVLHSRGQPAKALVCSLRACACWPLSGAALRTTASLAVRWMFDGLPWRGQRQIDQIGP